MSELPALPHSPEKSTGSIDKEKFEDESVIDRAAEGRARWKLDVVVVPMVCMFYLLSFLDRSNIGNARVAGLQTDLKLTNTQYSIALTVTYVPYIAAEFPANLLMKRLGANNTLPFMVVAWGIVTACQGAVKSYSGLLACRFFLGLAEGGMFPGIVLYLSSFYKRHNLQIRVSFLISSAALAGAFSGLLAAAIQQMKGDRGLSGWAWIFILEGVFTSCFGVFSYFVLPATSADAPLLTPEEAKAYTLALQEDWSGDQEIEPFSWSSVFSAFTSPFVMLLGIPLFFLGTTLFGLAYFTPTIVNALGNSPNRTQLLTVPPFACSWVVSLLGSYFADKYKRRGLTTVILSLIAAAGYLMFLVSPNKHVDYAALYLQIIGVYATAPSLVTWVANNVQPFYKRAAAIAFSFVMTNAGGILSTWIFTTPPRFTTPSRLNLSFSIGMAVFGILLHLYLSDENKKKEAKIAANDYVDTPEERNRLGDRHPLFLYTL